jgi:DNA-directed RNA polymerase alpha subunit
MDNTELRVFALEKSIAYITQLELGTNVCVISMAENMYKFLMGDTDYDKLLDSHIDDALNLTVRARNALVAHDINTVKDLVSKHENYLLRAVPNISKTSVIDIKNALSQIGLKLKE